MNFDFEMMGNEIEAYEREFPRSYPSNSLPCQCISQGYKPGEVYLLNQPLQCCMIAFIIFVAIVCNSLVIHNIWRSEVR